MDKNVDVSIRDCQVCFHAFDGGDRRPRCIPCGHTVCTKCVSDNLKKNVFHCPFCREKHAAKTPTDFPVNYLLENVYQLLGDGLLISAETPEPSSEPLQGLNKKMKSVRQELISGIESLEESSRGISSQLQAYKTHLEEWEDQHNQSAKTFLNIGHQHEQMAKSLRKENTRVSEAIKDEEEERHSMNMAKEKLLAAKVNKEVLPAIEEATQYFDILDNWTHETQEVFPNVKLITDGLMLQERAETLLQTLTEFDKMVATTKTKSESTTDNLSLAVVASLPHEATTPTDSIDSIPSPPESVLPKPSATVQDKLKDALEMASLVGKILKSGMAVQEKVDQPIFDATKDPILQNIPVEFDLPKEVHLLKQMMPSFEQSIEAGKVFAVKEHEGEMRFAKITLHEDRLCLHVLSLHTPPSDSFILQHNDVMSLVDPSCRRAFLKFGTHQSTLGTVHIDLTPDSKRAENFFALCSGQMGQSYLKTVIYAVSREGEAGEHIRCGDYEYNDGKGGKEVVLGAGKEEGGVFKKPWSEGSVCRIGPGENIASKFSIITKDFPTCISLGVFGKVASGLNVIRDAIHNYSVIMEIKIIDCGIVLDI